MTKTRLADLRTPFEFVEQDLELLIGVVVEFAGEAGDDAAQQHAAESRRRVDRQVHRAESDTTRRRDRPRVVSLEGRQRHGRRLLRLPQATHVAGTGAGAGPSPS